MDEQTAALQKEVDAVPYWHHTMSLGHGVVTPGGGGDTSHGLQRIGLPENLAGKTVLDIGAWDGFYSFECERRGAARVLASDLFVWRELRSDGKAGFELARRTLSSQVEDMEIDVFDIAPETVGMFDVVLFLGVLYHLRDPFGGLARAASVTRELLIVETHVDLLDLKRPAIAFYPGAELGGDATNWCGPNVPALLGMLKNLGLADAEVVSVEPRVGDREWLQTTGTGNGTQGTRRAVVHARRHLDEVRLAQVPRPASSATPGRLGHAPGPTEGERAAKSPATEDHAINEDHYWELIRQNRALVERTEALAQQVIELRHRLASSEEEVAASHRPLNPRWTAWPRRIMERLRSRRSDG